MDLQRNRVLDRKVPKAMTTDKAPVTIEEFSALLADRLESTPEIQPFAQLATIESPAKVGEALTEAGTWGWW
jgi:hypothetical protein